jgi:5-methylcytosine-specific restriction enzyme subunit McrC
MKPLDFPEQYKNSIKIRHSHFNFDDWNDLSYSFIFPNHRNNDDLYCYKILKKENDFYIEVSYFVGVDHIPGTGKTIYVSPKYNDGEKETDYLKMLFEALGNADVAQYTDELFLVKWDEPVINIEQKQDHLTPLLIVVFLNLLKIIVKKGVKRSYYRVENNLNSKIKGKILIAKNIKKNHVQNKFLNVYCSYEEYGINHPENRLLKKALNFVKRYLDSVPNLKNQEFTGRIYNFVNPAFENVSDEVQISEIKALKNNSFYKEYDQALRLAKMIIKRFGYNISSMEKKMIETPPFWIDMSKLFELYVLAQLKQKYGNDLSFQYSGKGTFLDFLVHSNDEKIIIDTKYKIGWSIGEYDLQDIRQLSGYSRDLKILEKLYPDHTIESYPVVNCHIIYPKIYAEEQLDKNPIENINGFYKFTKQPIKLPHIN